MLSLIESDFDINRVATNNEGAFFLAKRRDVWHLLKACELKIAPNASNLQIKQLHLPRFLVARACQLADQEGCPSNLGFPDGVKFSAEDGQCRLSFFGSTFSLTEEVMTLLAQDGELLEKAEGQVHAIADGYEVSDAYTHAGHQVETQTQSLAIAIAFERIQRGWLDATDFGVYSAYSTFRDFVHPDPTIRQRIADGMAREMITWNPDLIGNDGYWASVFSIQDGLFGQRIWGPGVDASVETMAESFSATFSGLPDIKFAQFVLMNGMQGGGPFHPLGKLAGLISDDEFSRWRTEGMQPDSDDEQEVISQVAFIDLLAVSDD